MATEKPNLRATRDSLRSLALYLLETPVRAKLAGSLTAAFTIEAAINMASTIMEAVIALEAHLGDVPPPTSDAIKPAALQPAVANGALAGGLAAMTAEMERMNKDILRENTARMEAIRQQAAETVQKSYAAMEAKIAEMKIAMQPKQPA